MITDRSTPAHTPHRGCVDHGRYDPRQINACKELRGEGGSWFHVLAATSGYPSAAFGTRVRSACIAQHVLKAKVCES